MERINSIRSDRRQSAISARRQSRRSVSSAQGYKDFRTDDKLGKLVNSTTIKLLQSDRTKALKRWELVLLVIFAVFVISHLAIFFTVKYAIHPSIPTPNNDKLFDEFENPLGYIVAYMVPYLKNWFKEWQHISNGGPENKNNPSLLLENSGIIEQDFLNGPTNTTNDCLETYFQGLVEHIPRSSPSFVRLVLQNLGGHMERSPAIHKALGNLLTEPQDLVSMYKESMGCLKDNVPFLALACVANDRLDPPDLTDFETRTIFEYAVNLTVVLEALTKYLEKDFHALSEFVEAMITSRRKEVEYHFEQMYADDKEYLVFALAKYRTMAVAAQSLFYTQKDNELRKNSFDKIAQLNIMEAVTLDLEHGRTENARAGLAVAVNTRVGGYVENGELLDRLGKDWVDAYIAWNFVFVFTSTLGTDRIGKLLMPSLSCTADPHVTQRFAQRRTISLALAMMHIYSPPKEKINQIPPGSISLDQASIIGQFYTNLTSQFLENDLDETSELERSLGQSNMEKFLLTDPDVDSVWKMFFSLCGQNCHGNSWGMTDSVPSSRWLNEDDDFYTYVGFATWVTVVFTAYGLEMFMVLVYEKNGWSQVHQNYWKLAQFLNPILGLVTFGLAAQRNYFSLITLILSFWKFGFPETVTNMYCSLYDLKKDKIKRICLFAEAVGLIIHHPAAALTICMANTGTIQLDRYVFDAIVILCFQHVVVLLKYFHRFLYIGVSILLEMWLEWTIFSNFEHLNHWTIEMVGCGILLSHWIWFIFGSIGFFREMFETKVKKTQGEKTPKRKSFFESFCDTDKWSDEIIEKSHPMQDGIQLGSLSREDSWEENDDKDSEA